jgi:hypothetical protein
VISNAVIPTLVRVDNFLESLSDESTISDLYASGWVDGNNADVYD